MHLTRRVILFKEERRQMLADDAPSKTGERAAAVAALFHICSYFSVE
jgi:hypothetical protein